MDYLFLSNTVLFRGISPEEVKSMMSCLQAYTRTYPRGTIIHHAGDAIHAVGILDVVAHKFQVVLRMSRQGHGKHTYK